MMTKPIDQALTDEMVSVAVEHCAERYFSGETEPAIQALIKGHAEACSALSDSLVSQIAGYLGQMDRMVKAVFEYEPEYATIHPRSHIGSVRSRKSGINLVVWVVRKSAALKALIAALEIALGESQRKIGLEKASPSFYSLDVKMVDDDDVRNRRGYGMIVSSHLVRSSKVWSRAGEPQPEEPEEPVEIPPEYRIAFDLELAPASKIIEQALEIERVVEDSESPLEHYLTEFKVALIRRIISDQLAYIDVAKRWFTIGDLADIFHRRIGYGRIGGKSAGMLLAARILQEVAGEELNACIHIPESFFLGSDLIYIFMAMNGLMHWNNQKYKPEGQIRAEYPRIRSEFARGQFPPEVIEQLQVVLEKIGSGPLIVRSSSQLEDNFGTSFAGKYDSFFCPNQGTPDENLKALTVAVSHTYASTLKPEALLYRRSKGLQDYDERMAVLIQAAQGDKFGRYFFPFGAGVAFSRNIYRWSPQIRREDGFARMVWGLGTRAVERVGDDYARPVALSHPTLQPKDSAEAIRRYSQQYIDLIDLEDNVVKTMPVHDVITPRYPNLNLLAQLEQDGFFATPRMRVKEADLPRLAITFHELLARTSFAPCLSRMLRLLEENYHSAVDVEFTIHVPAQRAANPPVQISLLQCRPQSYLHEGEIVRMPEDLSPEDMIFSSHFIVPQGYLPDIRYVLFVKPEKYFSLATAAERSQVGAVISRLNAVLEEKSFICLGPGRWGSLNMDLGVFVSYADIHNAGALVELSGANVGPAPEPSLGTHFFQDLMEAQIYPLAIQLDDDKTVFNHDFFYNAPNKLRAFVEASDAIADCVVLVEVASFKARHHLNLVMEDEQGLAVAYLAPDDQEA